MQKHIFKISSYTQKMTPNPIHAIKTTFHHTKHTNNTKIHFQKTNISNNKLVFYKITISIFVLLYIKFPEFILYILLFTFRAHLGYDYTSRAWGRINIIELRYTFTTTFTDTFRNGITSRRSARCAAVAARVEEMFS